MTAEPTWLETHKGAIEALLLVQHALVFLGALVLAISALLAP